MRFLNIIIVNWNAGDSLLKALQSIIRSSINKSIYEIFVVDNNSSDNSIESIKCLSTNLRIIYNGSNVGFGSACNIVLREHQSEYVLFMNPDVELEPDSLEKSIMFLENNRQYDILGVKNYDLEGTVAKSCARFPTTFRLINDMLGLSKVLPRIFKPGTEMSDWDHLTSREVDHVIAAYMLCRYSILKEVGFFDEEFFLYLEDLDLSRRIKKVGGKIYYNSKISIIHEGGGTSKNIKSKRLFYSLRSRIIYCRKYLKPFSALFLTCLSLSLEPFLRIVQLLVTANVREFKSVLKAYHEYCIWLRRS